MKSGSEVGNENTKMKNILDTETETIYNQIHRIENRYAQIHVW